MTVTKVDGFFNLFNNMIALSLPNLKCYCHTLVNSLKKDNMDTQAVRLIKQKNQWLSHHVDVDFPTQESLKGRELYLSSQESKTFKTQLASELLDQASHYPIWLDDIVPVDFHRLTILFSVLQAKAWSNEPEQEKLIIEFLTQIILDEHYQLYMGFKQGQPMMAMIAYKDDQTNSLLLSDVYTQQALLPEMYLPLIASMIHLYQTPNDLNMTVIYEA